MTPNVTDIIVASSSFVMSLVPWRILNFFKVDFKMPILASPNINRFGFVWNVSEGV